MAAESEVCGGAATEKRSSASVPKSNLTKKASPAGDKKNKSYNSVGESDSNSQMKNFVDLLKNLKLNPMAKEFVPSYYYGPVGLGAYYVILPETDFVKDVSASGGSKKRNNTSGRRRTSSRASKAQREESIKRTIYISDIESNVTEEQIAELFGSCGQIQDCRVCGDPRTRLRFAFVEFLDEPSAKAAIGLSGVMLGSTPIKVMPSKTAILPVNPTFLPRSEDEREMCGRTIYCTNIDRKVSEDDIKNFFEAKCGEVSQLRLLVDHTLATKIAFVEFSEAASATLALECCGEMMGSKHMRISPSKTPVRSLTTRNST